MGQKGNRQHTRPSTPVRACVPVLQLLLCHRHRHHHGQGPGSARVEVSYILSSSSIILWDSTGPLPDPTRVLPFAGIDALAFYIFWDHTGDLDPRSRLALLARCWGHRRQCKKLQERCSQARRPAQAGQHGRIWHQDRTNQLRGSRTPHARTQRPTPP